MLARSLSVNHVNEIIAMLSALGGGAAWLLMSFLQTALNWEFALIEKLAGAGGTAFILFFLLRWALKRNDEQQRKLIESYEARIQEQKEAREQQKKN